MIKENSRYRNPAVRSALRDLVRRRDNRGKVPGNYVVLATSCDCGRSWREIQVIVPPAEVADSRA